MKEVIYGKVTYNDKDYSFNFQNNILIIQPPELDNAISSYFDYMSNKNYTPKDTINLSGITSDGYQIIFTKIKLQFAGSGCFISFVPAYAISKANAIIVKEINGFEKMKLKGECIDNFYSNRKIVKDFGFRKNNKPYMIFKHQKETLTEINMDFGNITFANSWSFPCKGENNAVVLTSYLNIDLNLSSSVDDIINYYSYIHNFFKFINNRLFIEFKEIIISIPIILNKKKSYLDFILHITSPEEKVDFPSKFPFIVTFEEISPYFEKLCNLVNNKDFSMYHLPYNKNEESYVTISKYLLVSSVFESHFDKLYPNYKSNKNPEYKEIKEKTLKFLDSNKGTEKSKNKKYWEKFYDDIEKLEGSLSEQLTFVLNEFEPCIRSEKEFLMKRYEIKDTTNNDLAIAFERKRNQISHGSLNTGFDTLELITYNLLEKIVHIIVFREVGIPTEKITNLVEKIFRS